MNIKSKIIFITGYPGTGKTTLGKKIAREFDIPFISKDDIKEILFDSVGWKDRPLNIGGSKLTMDTTNFDKIDYNKIFEFVRDNLNGK